MDYLTRLLYGPWDEKNFVLIPPGEEIDEADFLAPGEEVHIQGA